MTSPWPCARMQASPCWQFVNSAPATVMSRSSGSSCRATPRSSSTPRKRTSRNVTERESRTSATAGCCAGCDAQVAHDDVLRAPDGDARDDGRRTPDELDPRARREVEELQRRHPPRRQANRPARLRHAVELGLEPGRVLGELVERVAAVMPALHHAMSAVRAGREHAQQHDAGDQQSALTKQPDHRLGAARRSWRRRSVRPARAVARRRP